ncbi:VOC family protein [Variovorax sp. OV329]|uniref:VOC family protein n=1 Tax=Variovorax sp. OV329 TaxID=1882825 RepID=UPI0008ECBBA5|nr:VOC family protein [Variovorax sp. OV329]SFN19567.1 Glyoxalase/Bleomycin resistance protein/Dioxygenase superfamily protein [Variovorax sp. OV329]
MSKKTPSDLQFSHFGLYVRDLPRMAAFYKQALRFTQTDAGDLGTVQLVFLSRDPAEHHQLVLATGRPEALPFNVVNQISFRVPDIATLRRFHDRLLAHGASDMHPVTHGNAVSIYCRDPEGNRLELFMDTPWYCEQPLREPIDIAQPDEAILAQAEAIAKRFPKFMSRAEWQAEVARRMQEDQRGD